jgi:PHD/YefM family antitoxin component YafN of YafNO toxin-antitoxin module
MWIHGKHETEWITMPLEEYDSLKRTIAVLSDENIMAQIQRGRQKNARSRDFEEVVKELKKIKIV